MLTNFFLYTLYLVLKIILSPLTLLNDVSLTGSFASAITTANGYISVVDSILPLTTLLIIMGLFFVIEGGIFGFKLLTWIIKKIPFLN